MGRASASITVPGRAAGAERLWYDTHRWPSWIDGFGHLVELDGDWPDRGARVVWESPPGGRGRVQERVTAYEVRIGQTLEVEDATLSGRQKVAFKPGPRGDGDHALARVRDQGPQRAHADRRRAVRAPRRCASRCAARCTRFCNERAAEIQFG